MSKESYFKLLMFLMESALPLIVVLIAIFVLVKVHKTTINHKKKNIKQKINFGSSLLAVFLFCLPWLDFQCSGKTVFTQSGVQGIIRRNVVVA